MSVTLTVNGRQHVLDIDPFTPLLYVLRDDLELNAAKFGCGLAQCGACTVLVDGVAAYSCLMPASAAQGKQITTVEGLASGGGPGRAPQAFIDEQAAQCGYCIAGMIMRAEALLRATPKPTEAEIRTEMHANLCRCGTHMRILRAVRRAAGLPAGEGEA